MTKKFLLFFILLAVSFHSIAQKKQLRAQIKQVLAHKKADVGVSVYGIENKNTITVENHGRNPYRY